MNNNGRSTSPALIALLLALTSCGGGNSDSSSNANSSGEDDVASGGIGGSGSGTTSDYGSIIVNGTGTTGRKLIVEANTTLSLDGATVPFVDGASELPLGATVEFLLAEDVSDDVRSGTAIDIRAYHRVIGPITSTSPLTVLNQTVMLSDGVVLGDSDGCMLDTDALDVGDVVAVAGPVKADGSIAASRFVDAECEDDTPTPVRSDWRLLGRIDHISDDSFTIGGQTITTLGTPIMECPATLTAQQKVYLTLSLGVPADGLNALEMTCVPDGLAILSSVPVVPENLPVSFSGIITAAPVGSLLDIVNLDGEVIFEIDGQKVRVDSLTSVLNGTVFGTLSAVQLGLHVDVDGTLDSDGVINAENIHLLPSLLDLIDDTLGDLLRLLLGGLTASSSTETAPAAEKTFIDSPITLAAIEQLLSGTTRDDRDAGFSSKSATSIENSSVAVIHLSLNTDTHINITQTGPHQPTEKFLAALQYGIDVAFATDGEVVFGQDLIAFHN